MAALVLCKADGDSKFSLQVEIHNGLVSAPAAIAFVVNNERAFVLDVGCVEGTANYFVGLKWDGSLVRPGIAAPDDSIHELIFRLPDTNVRWSWGRTGSFAVGRLQSDKTVTVKLIMVKQMWPGFAGVPIAVTDGLADEASLKDGRQVTWRLKMDVAPISRGADSSSVVVGPDRPVHLVAGMGNLPKLDAVDAILDNAEEAYRKRRPSASGDWGDFVGPIADNVNNSRVYSSDNHLVAHTVTRAWARGPNGSPYFCWDSFFTALLASLDDPETAKNTVRAVLKCATPQGFVPNFGHWPAGGHTISEDRSQPPVGAFCVWKMCQRWPDRAFLQEVYPKLVKWHQWWPTARDGKHDGLLEWGGDNLQEAKYETGWDDSIEYSGAKMVGKTMNVYAVDLNSLWAMDAEYLALIAAELGRNDEAASFRDQQREMNQRINRILWNEKLGIYCSRLWGEDGKPGAFLTRLTPINFYPLICSAPDAVRAKRVLKVLSDPSLFWGQWKIPTVSYNDPVWPQQQYWHGNVWGPVNYLVFQGLKRYGATQLRNDLAASSVALFMRNWIAHGACGENYMSTDGTQSPLKSDRNYTWGALLCLIGLENIVDQDKNGQIVTDSGCTGTMEFRNIPMGGILYRVQLANGKCSMTPEHP